MADSASFSFDVAGAVQGQMPINPSTANIGYTGNTGPASVSIAPGMDLSGDNSAKTIQALMKLGGDLLAPHVQAARTQKAAEGAIAALQGVSAAEIQAAEPMQGFFGDSVTVSSARQVEQMTAVNKLSNDMLRNMPTLQEQSPEQFRKWLPTQLRSLMQGDPQTDALITQAFMERVPGIVDGHAKAHAGFVQERARQAWSGSLDEKGQALELEYATGANSNGVVLAQQAFLESLAGPEGIHAPAYGTWVNQAYKRAAAQGNLRVLNLIEDSGVLTSTQTDEQAAALQRLQDSAENKVAARSPSLFVQAGDRGLMESHIGFGTSPFQSKEELLQWVGQYNTEYMDTYGGSKPPIDTTAAKNLVEQWNNGMVRAAERLASGDTKDITGAVIAAKVALGSGNAQSLKGVPGQTPEVLNLASRALFADLQDKPDQLAFAVMQDTDNEWPIIHEKLKGTRDFFLSGGTFNAATAEGFRFLAQLQKAGPGGDAAIGRYLGEEFAGIALEAMSLGLNAESPEEMKKLSDKLSQVRFTRPVQLDSGQLTEVRSEIDSAVDTGVLGTRFFGGDLGRLDMTEGGKQELTRMVQPMVGAIMRGTAISPAKATRMALGMVSDNIDMIGGVPVAGQKLLPNDERTLERAVNKRRGGTYIKQTNELYQRALNGLIKTKLSTFKPAVGGFAGIWSDPVAERGTFMGSQVLMDFEGVDGNNYPVTITVDEMIAAMAAVQSEEKRPAKRRNQRVDPIKYQ